MFKAALVRRFSALVNPKAVGVPGSYLAIEATEALASVGQTIISDDGVALTLSARGGATNGVSALLTGGRLNARFGASAQVHFLTRERRSLTYTPESCTAMQAAAYKAEASHAQRMAELAVSATGIQRRIARAELQRRASAVDEALRRLPKASVTSVDSLTRDSLRLDSARIAAQQRWQDSVVSMTALTEVRLATNARNAAYEAAARLLEIRGVSLSWWSLAVTFDNARFSLIDPAAPPSDQLTDRSFLTRVVSATYSRLSQSPFPGESRYLSITLRAGWESNLTDLTRLEVVDRTPIGTDALDRVTEKRSIAYSGAYRENIATFSAQADYYRFLVPHNRLALHLFPSFTVGIGRVGQPSVGAGLLLSFPRADKPESLVNAELFFNAVDVLNVRQSQESPWQRGVLGLQVAFPISFSPGS